MRRLVTSASLVSLVFQGFMSSGWANRINDPDMPLSHCYHWLDERTSKYLTFKYQYASKNNGELTFYTTAATSNGAVAGPGLYCAKTPVGSYAYGDRVIRIDFVDDIVMTDGSGQKVCGTNGRFYSSQAECDSKPVDVLLYDHGSDWYVIQNPQAIKSWSANSDQLVSDLNVSKSEFTAAATHLDMTIQALQAEIQQIGKKTVFNSHARLGLEQILKNPSQLNKIPTLSLIDMIASYSGKMITDQDKASLYVTHFDKALKDKLLAFSDFTNTLKNNPFLKPILVSRIEKINFSQLNLYNTATLITAIDHLDIKISSQQAQSLWQNALVSASSLDPILQAHLKKNGIFSKEFDSSLPSVNTLVTVLKDHNLIPMLKLLNEFVDPKGNSKSYTEALFDRILKSGSHSDFTTTYDAINNQGLNKAAALSSLIAKEAKAKFAGVDPIGTGLLFEKVRSQFSTQEQQTIESDLRNLPIKVSKRLTYQILEDYQYGKLTLPGFYDEKTFLLHLADRSIAERSLGKNTTNVFRMVLSGYYSYFAKAVGQAKGASRDGVMKRASDFFVSLADHLLAKKQYSYSYVAFQNGLYFGSHMKSDDHPLQTALEWINQGDSNLDQIAEESIKTSLDPSVLMFLSKTEIDGHGVEALKSRKLLDSLLGYLASTEFKQELKSADFMAGQAERKDWANIVKGSRVYSDICSFFRAYEKVEDKILSSRSSLDPAPIDVAKAVAQRAFCKKGSGNP